MPWTPTLIFFIVPWHQKTTHTAMQVVKHQCFWLFRRSDVIYCRYCPLRGRYLSFVSAFSSYLHSCPSVGIGWHRGCWCWWWARWGHCQGSCSDHSQGRYSEGLSMEHLGRILGEQMKRQNTNKKTQVIDISLHVTKMSLYIFSKKGTP